MYTKQRTDNMQKHFISKIAAAMMSAAMLFSATATAFAEPVEDPHGYAPKGAAAEAIADGYVGDTDNSGVVDVSDATRIQLHLSPKSDANVLSGLPLQLADVNRDGTVDVTDATMIQLYSAGNKDKAGKTGAIYLDNNPTDALKVKFRSNLFPEVTRTYSTDTKQLTVTYKVNISDYLMLNSQWRLYFDQTKLRLNKASNPKPFPVCSAGAVVNIEPYLTSEGYATANASDLYGYEMTDEDGKPVDYVTLTFDVADGATGTAYVYFDLYESSFLDLDNKRKDFKFYADSEPIPELAYLKDCHYTEVTAK